MDDAATTPSAIRQAGPRTLEIVWGDGHVSRYDVRDLRLACACAVCIDEWTGAERLDPAFRRPGRIDLLLAFPRPDERLRRRFVVERWHPDLVRAIDVDAAVERSDGLSFAELDELKKLLVLHYLDSGRWDWDRAWSAYQAARGAATQSGRIGFAAGTPARHRAPAAVSAGAG